MEGSVMDLSEYRLDKAKEDLETAEENLNAVNSVRQSTVHIMLFSML
jgi:hypothetical protein